MKAGVLDVCRCTVIALHVVLLHELPVCADRVAFAVGHLCLAPTVAARRAGEHRLHILEPEWLISQADEDQTLDDAKMHGLEPIPRTIEVRGRMSCGTQCAVEIVAPGVIGANEGASAGVPAPLGADARAAVPADVEQRAQPEV